MPTREPIRVINAALADNDGHPIVRGDLEASSVGHLLIPAYQREVLSDKKIRGLMKAFRDPDDQPPDIEINLRGTHWGEAEPGVYVFYDVAALIDGQQRKTAVQRLLLDPEDPFEAQLGVKVHINRTLEWEVERFRKLNFERSQLSANVWLRDLGLLENHALKMLYNLTTQHRDFPMYGRVTWKQGKGKRELVSAVLYCASVAQLHGHITPGRSNNADAIADGLRRLADIIGIRILSDNVKTFYGIFEECWSITEEEFGTPTVLKANFVTALARLLSDHQNFWSETMRLEVSANDLRKLRAFPIGAQVVKEQAGGGGDTGRGWLYDQFKAAIDSGRRGQNRLELWPKSALTRPGRPTAGGGKEDE